MQVARYDPDAQRRTETATRGRDFIIGACDDDTETVSVWGQLLAPDAVVMQAADRRDGQRVVRQRSAQCR